MFYVKIVIRQSFTDGYISGNEKLKGQANVLILHPSNGCITSYQDSWGEAGVHYIRLCHLVKSVPVVEEYLWDNPMVNGTTGKTLLPPPLLLCGPVLESA